MGGSKAAITDRWQGYRVLHYMHRVAFVLGFIALAAFAINAYRWGTATIFLPA